MDRAGGSLRSRRIFVTVLLAAAALLLLVGSFLVVRTIIELDADRRDPRSAAAARSAAPREHRRAA